MPAFSVKFKEMFENNTHQSDSDIWPCSLKFADMVDNKTWTILTCKQALWSLSKCLKYYPSVRFWLVSFICEVHWNVWYVKSFDMFKKNMHYSKSDMRVGSVKFLEMIEINTHMSDSDVWACAVKFVSMYKSDTHWRVSDLLVCWMKFFKKKASYSNTNVWVGYVKFVKIFESNTYWSDCDV